MANIYLTISLSAHNGDDIPQNHSVTICSTFLQHDLVFVCLHKQNPHKFSKLFRPSVTALMGKVLQNTFSFQILSGQYDTGSRGKVFQRAAD